MYLIAESADESQLRRFLAPFEEAGTVDIFPAFTCEGVAASGGCGAEVSVSEMAALDPEDACEDAIESGLVVLPAHPLNCETSIPALIGGVVMPNQRFYLRNHFHIPTLDPETYRLSVGGLVERNRALACANSAACDRSRGWSLSSALGTAAHCSTRPPRARSETLAR